jgi:hypothetical protein
MFVRAGAIIPMGPEMNFIGEKPSTPTLMIYPDDKGGASTTLYEDDGTSPDYRQGVFRRTPVSVEASGRGYQLSLSAPQGKYVPPHRSLTFTLKPATAVRQVLVDGRVLVMNRPGETQDGWFVGRDGLTVRIKDDGKAHQILIR